MDAHIDAFDKAADSTECMLAQAVRSGIEAYATVQLNQPGTLADPILVRGWDDDEVCTAASINKLAIALWALRAYQHAGRRILTWSAADCRTGGGDLDKPDAPLAASVEYLLADMLARSSNTAAAVLGRHNADLVNGELHKRGYRYTRLRTVGTEGRFETGTTNPREALRLLGDVMSACRLLDDRIFGRVILDALHHSRSHFKAKDIKDRWSKHGELNGSDNDGEYLRHEVGVLEGHDGYSIGYSVFLRFVNTASPTVGVAEAWLAERFIALIGGKLVEAIGGDRSRVIPRFKLLTPTH